MQKNLHIQKTFLPLQCTTKLIHQYSNLTLNDYPTQPQQNLLQRRSAACA